MKTLLNPKNLPRLTLVLGVLGFALRRVLYAVAVDHKNLLVSHPLGFALGAVTLAAMALIIAGVLRWNHEPLGTIWSDSWNLTTLLFILGPFSLLIEGGFASSRLILARSILAILAGASLVLLTVLRKRNKQPSFLLYAILSLFFAVHMVSCYQGWSSNPQIQDYVFTLLASVGLMLYFYQKTAAAVDYRKDKRMLAIGLLTSFFCFVALSGTVFPILYLCGGYWVLTDLPEALSGE